MKKTVNNRLKILEIPPYTKALKVLFEDLKETGMKINLESFYSTKPKEIHNFVDTLTYCFITINNEQLLIYAICCRPNVIYKEVTYDGKILCEDLTDIEFFRTSKLIGREKKKILGYLIFSNIKRKN